MTGLTESLARFVANPGFDAVPAEAARIVRTGFIETVGMLLPNSIAAVSTAYAMMLAGACETSISWTSTDAELRWAVALAKVRRVVTNTQRAAALHGMGCARPTVHPGGRLAPFFNYSINTMPLQG